jgi:hypothetical protein
MMPSTIITPTKDLIGGQQDEHGDLAWCLEIEVKFEIIMQILTNGDQDWQHLLCVGVVASEVVVICSSSSGECSIPDLGGGG